MKDSQSPFPVDFYSLACAYYKEHQSWRVCWLGVRWFGSVLNGLGVIQMVWE